MFKRLCIAAGLALACAGQVLAAPAVALGAPANNTKYLPPAAITLAASATDSSDTINQVDFYNGTILIGTATVAPYSATWSNVTSGRYSVTAKATNSHGISKMSAARTVIVNSPPTIALTAPAATPYAGLATINLAADAQDSDGSIAKVDFYHGATLIGTATAAPYTATWGNAAPGSYKLTAKATDNLGGVTTSTAVTVTVTNPVTVSWAAPANNARFLPSTAITLTANAADTNGSIVQVAFFDGATQIGTAASAPYSLTWDNAAVGSHAITARATDSQGLTKTSAAIKIIVDTPPTISLTSPTAGSSYVGLATIDLAADVSDTDGSISKVQFYRGATLIGTATAAPYAFTWANVQPGNYTLTARATDNLGGVSVTAPVSVTVSNPVTVSLAAPLNNARFIPPAAIDLTANATDSNGTIAQVDFYNGATLIGSVANPPYTVPWTNVPVGKYKVTAKATDSQGVARSSSAITIVVDTSPNVTLTAPANNSSYNEPAAITLTADASDPDGTIAKVAFYHGSTLLATLTGPPYTTTWNNVAKGTYKLTAKATDNLGVTTSSTLATVIVGAHLPPTVSLSSPTSPSGLIAPAAIALAATAGSSDGSIAQVEFFNGAALIGRVMQAPYSFNWNNVGAGSYSLTARATDTLGAATDSAPLAFTVASNGAPAVSLTSPADNQTLTGPTRIVLAATATDADGSIAQVEFLDGASVLATVTSAPYTATIDASPGSYLFAARATDNLGATTSSAVATVTVLPNNGPAITVSATPGSSTAPAGIMLAAAASDADGSIAQVEFFNGTTSLGITSQAPYTATWANVAAGTYSVTAKATDNLGAVTTAAPVAVTLNPAPSISLATPLDNASYAAPAAIALTANAAPAAATAAAGGTLTGVDYYNGATLIGSASAAPYGISWSNVAAGTYSITAIATDSLGATATSTPITVTVVNDAPPTVSLAATPSTAIAPASVTLTATAADADGTVAQVEFFNGTTSLGTSTEAPYSMTLANLAPGSYTYTASATDNLGTASTSAPVTVTVSAAPVIPTVSLTAPTAQAVYGAPAAITLSATAAPATVNSSISQVAFYSGGQFVGNATQPPYSIVWSQATPGQYTITATATDSSGATATSAPISVTVVNNTPPVITLTATPDHATASATLQLNATATDSDGTVAQVEFFSGTTSLGVMTQAPYSFAWSNVTVGNYSVSAKATDNLGTVTTSSPVAVAVTGTAASVYYIQSDQLNTPRVITDQNNNVVWNWGNDDPFGNNLPTATAFEFNLRFAGQYYDQETGTHYNYARDYDPNTGRFLESDPIGLNGGINTYGYANSNPVSLIDPSGLTGVSPDNVPGGPWTPNPKAPRPGNFLGPKPSSGGRTQCQWVPPEGQGGPPGSKGYWKTNDAGSKTWDRYSQNGDPITPEEAHPSPPRSAPSPTPRSAPPVIVPPPPNPLYALILLVVPGNLMQNPFAGGNEMPQTPSGQPPCGCEK